MMISPRPVFLRLLFFLLRLLVVGATLWCMGALYYDLPWAEALRLPLAMVYGIAVLGGLLVWRRGWVLGLGGFAVILGWWLQIVPRDDLPWQADVARTAFAEIDGDQIVLHNIRHCDYRSEFDYTPHWTTRSLDLNKITGIDLAVVNWGPKLIAHTIVSFQVEGESPVPISIETRKRIGESYSTIAGFYRQYGLIYIVSDERDVIRLRTNYREGEIVYLYRINVSPERARLVFLDYLRRINSLHRQPEFYNAVTSNCTTNIRTHAVATAGESFPFPWDWRILANGYLDELLYERDALAGEGTFQEIKARSVINEAASAIGDGPDFSRCIREAIGW